MHNAAWNAVVDFRDSLMVMATRGAAHYQQGLDIGGRDINGSCRQLFPQTIWTVLDKMPGGGVDIVADARTWNPQPYTPKDQLFDLVICTEVFEHCDRWWEIVRTARRALKNGHPFIVTCAGPDRAPHSEHDGGGLRNGEYYRNVEPKDLHDAMTTAGFDGVVIIHNDDAHDLYAIGWAV